MSDPLYEPRDYAQPRDRFGWDQTLIWPTPQDPRERVRVESSRLQHAFAFTIRQKIRSRTPNPETGKRRNTIRAYSEQIGVGYGRFSRALRGEATLRFDDIATANLVLGDIYEVAIENYRHSSFSTDSPLLE